MIVLVTGCRSGFGLHIAVRAARAGHTVYAGLRDLSTKDALLEAAAGLDVRPVQLDVVDEAQQRDAVDAIVAEHGRLDALVNNAGVALGGFWEQVEEDELRRLFDVNVFAPWALTKRCLPHLRAVGREGIVINVTSMAGRQAMPGLGMYAASKFALEGMTEALRHELRPFGVRVVLVEPGPYRTDIFGRNRTVAKNADDASPYAPYLAKLEAVVAKLEPKMGDPVEVADLVVRLLTDPRPRLRYPLGPGVPARLWARRVLPFEGVEKIIQRVVGF